MTQKFWIALSAGGSAALLAGAYIFQALGYPPCAMCLWQRWPHFAAIAIGLIALRVGGRALPALGALAAATTSAIGVYHTGVERDWWEGPTSCTGGGGLDGLSGADLLTIAGPRVIQCDQVSWELFSLSMASWNALFSGLLVVGWIMAVRARS
ncbi:MAG: disulfide bond formation protein B [Yoonia sp.]|uniref:disulfide bond formation protein B n=1 Tax=Yoonia sp. TaxID=2212373 RepID=UPI003EF4AF5E